MNSSGALLMTFIVLLGIFGVRNQLVYSIRLRRIEAIHAETLAAIRQGEAYRGNEYDQLPSYDSMLFDVQRWTYAQFFGAEA